jgi:hypothetical protein
MKVLVFVKATPNSEKGLVPSDEKLSRMLADMGKFNDQLIKAGILKDGDGLKPSSAGKRIKFSDNGATLVVDGPFAETKELVAGYWVWDVESMEEAVDWARRCPNPMPGEEGVLEVRPTYSAEEFEQLVGGEENARVVTKKPKATSASRKKAERKSKSKGKASAPKRAKAKKARRR